MFSLKIKGIIGALIGILFVILSLAGCGSSSSSTNVSVSTGCPTAAQLTSARNTLTRDQATVKKDHGSASQGQAKANVTRDMTILGKLLGASTSCHSNTTSTTSSTSSTSTTSSSVAANPKKANAPNKPTALTLQEFTVNRPAINCVQLVQEYSGAKSTFVSGDKTLVKFDIGALHGVSGPNARLYGDSLSVALKAGTPQDTLAQVEASICKDPEVGLSDAYALCNLNIGGTTLGSLNVWLRPYCVSASNISLMAAKFDVARSGGTVVLATSQDVAWQGDAAWIDTMLTRFTLVGFQSNQSTWNLHLVAGGLDVAPTTLPAVEVNKQQEHLKALVLAVTQKGATCGPLAELGLNVFDQRPELFALKTCTPAPKPTPGTSPSTTGSHYVPPTSTPMETTLPPTTSETTTPPAVTTVPPPATTVTTSPPTTNNCAYTGKCNPGTIVQPPATTVAPPSSIAPTTTQPTVAPPTTTAPRVTTPPTLPPTTNPTLPPSV